MFSCADPSKGASTSRIALAAVTLLGAFLRFYHLSFGIGTHPDERHMVMVTERLSMSDLNPHSFAYGSFSYYLVWICSQLLGTVWPFLASYDGIFMVGRSVCALFGLAGVLLTYLLAYQLYQSRVIALTSAALLSFNFFHIQLSRYFTSDVILTTLCLAALCAILAFERSAKLRYAVLSGILIGITFATKISGVFLLFPLAIAFGSLVFGSRQISLVRGAAIFLLVLVVVALTAFLCAPYALLDFKTFLANTREQTNMVQGVWRPPYTIQYERTAPFLYHLEQMFHYTFGWPVGCAIVAGLGISLWQGFKKPSLRSWLVHAWVGLFFIATAGLQVKFPRYLLPLYPVLCSYAALALCFPLSAVSYSMETRVKPSLQRREVHGWNAFRLGIVALLLFAFMLRFYAIETIPFSLHNDEMSAGLAATKFISDPNASIFSIGWLGRPSLGYFLTSIGLRLFDDPLYGLRMTALFWGMLSLLVPFFFGWYGWNWRVGLVAVALVSLCHWHIHFSRTGYYFMQGVALSSWAVLLAFLGEDRSKLWLYALSGALFGVSFQSYELTFVPCLAVLIWIGGRLLFGTKRVQTALGIVIWLGALIFSLLPALQHIPWRSFLAPYPFLFSENAWRHASSVVGSSAWGVILSHQMQALFSFWGRTRDGSVQYGFSGFFFDPVTTCLIIGGVVLALRYIKRSAEQLLLLWTLCSLLFCGILSLDAPFLPRLLPFSSFIFLFAGLAIEKLRGMARTPFTARAFVLGVSAWMVLVISLNLYSYFGVYSAEHPGVRRDAIVRLLNEQHEIRSVLNASPESENFEFESYQFLAPGIQGVNVPPRTEQAELCVAQPALVVSGTPIGQELFQGPITISQHGDFPQPQVSAFWGIVTSNDAHVCSSMS